MTDENAPAQAAEAPSGDPGDGPGHEALLAAAGRVRLCVRLAALAAVLICLFSGGGFWAVGAVAGALLVEINMGLLLHTLTKAAQWRGRSLGPTLVRFYLAFGVTAFVCFLVIRNHWGHPLGFLAGLLSFLAGLILALISLAVRPVQAD